MLIEAVTIVTQARCDNTSKLKSPRIFQHLGSLTLARIPHPQGLMLHSHVQTTQLKGEDRDDEEELCFEGKVRNCVLKGKCRIVF